jgi:hypothetical protein
MMITALGRLLTIGTTLFTVALALATAQAQNLPTDTQRACGVAAATDYNKANLAMMQEGLQRGEPLMSVETTIAQRRLQEQYCLRFVRCVLGDDQTSLRFRAAFDRCLEDEALEKYEAVPRDRLPE